MASRPSSMISRRSTETEQSTAGSPPRVRVTSNCSMSAAARSAAMAVPAATTFRASKTPSRSAPVWPIGVAKRPIKLAFEQIVQYICCKATATQSRCTASRQKLDAGLRRSCSRHREQEAAVDLHHVEGVTSSTSRSRSCDRLLHEKLFGHEREGFIWQKLRAPRSYDYKKTENKGYNERLRMPKFNLDDDSASRSSRSCWGWWPSRRPRNTSTSRPAPPGGARRPAVDRRSSIATAATRSGWNVGV